MKLCSLLCAFLLASNGLVAAGDPFIGRWVFDSKKVNVQDFTHEIKDVGANGYEIIYIDGASITVKDDGKEVHRANGGTSTLQKLRDRSWKLVSKRETTETDMISISEDNQTMKEVFVTSHPNGENSHSTMVWKRVSGKEGLVGKWRGISETNDFSDEVNELRIQPFKGSGLSFEWPADKEVVNLMMDGSVSDESGPRVAKVTTVSGKRIGTSTLSLDYKVNDKESYTETYKIGTDGKSITLTAKYVGQPKPIVVVYNRK